ncbi:TauD/TfdA family dioxygenase [Desmonostoc muscorum LEGE 12446]|uniref:TauD/TfdA family dioxygenase n=1 Tax=Desmonostoc muscorum LEGE 12446 TaxID=1828758 RepID=A0A8J7AGW7_DESMC|nr:TauD/TfdA family dioxygenase [Desmonostoc muscorum]MCF2148657.1 TauD/TfdA family dioxygenase [Desmonostoc muscorum LEGE 12446]
MNTKIQSISNDIGKEIININNITVLELDKEEIINLFKSYGILIFRGFMADAEIFKEFTNSLSTDFINYAGGTFNRRVINGDIGLIFNF